MVKVVNWILSFFGLRLEIAEKINRQIGEIITPERFRYIDTETSSQRTREESLELYKNFKSIERSKQIWIARNTNDKVIQEKILTGDDQELVENLMTNKYLDEELQFRVARDVRYESYTLRSILARKVGLILGVQEMLAKDSRPEVRRMLTRWQRPTNPSIAHILLEDQDIEVRKSLARNIGEKIKVDNMICFSGHAAKIQEKLCRDKSEEVRLELTLNENITPAAQLILIDECFKRQEWDSLVSLAKNKAITKESRNKMILAFENINNFKSRLILKTLKENKPI